MGEIKHTPGPWEVVRHGDDGRRNPNGSSYWIMPVAGHGTGWVGDDSYLNILVGSEPCAPANARLIAAAPDHALIAAALCSGVARWDCSEFCVGGLCHSTELDEFGVPVMTNGMRAALAKANGERPPLPPTARCE